MSASMNMRNKGTCMLQVTLSYIVVPKGKGVQVTKLEAAPFE